MTDFLDDLKNLPGVKGGRLKGARATTVSGMMKALQKHRAVSDAGDNGSITVYRDDGGRWRCYYFVYMQTVAETNVDTKAAVRRWLEEWHPHQRRAA